MVRRILQKTLTYLTIVSAILLPAVGALWLRTYSVNDRITRARDGRATIFNTCNGEAVIWTAPIDPSVTVYEHRKRESMENFRFSSMFSRFPSEVHFNALGFSYAHLDRLPSRSLESTGRASAVIVPLWAVALLLAILPLGLLVRNSQSSEEWNRLRSANGTDDEGKKPESETAPAPEPDDLVLPTPDFSSNLPHRPIRTAPSMRRWR